MKLSFRKKNEVIIVSVFAIFLSFLITSCSPRLKVNRLKPAEVNLSTYKKVAVAECKGPSATEIGDTLSQKLFENQRFEVLDRSNLDRILKEQNLSISDVSDPNSSVKLGKVIGSSALIFGNVYKRDYGQKRSTKKGTCYKDKREYTCYTYYVTGNWNLKVGFKMIDTATGKIIATKVIEDGGTRYNSSRDGRPEVSWDKEQVFSTLQDNVINKFMKMIAPYTVVVEVKLFEDSDLPTLERGVKFASGGDWNTAIEQFTMAVEKANSDPEIDAELRAEAHYNLGVAYGYSGQYDKGLEWLKKACKINPDDDFFVEIGKIKGFKKDAEKLKQQGVKTSALKKNIKVIPLQKVS